MKVVCGANLRKKPGRTCQRSPLAGSKRCLLHGGKSLSGPAHPGYKTGRHSKFLPAQLAARYQEALNDPSLISMRAEMALVAVRVGQLLEAVGTTSNLRLWKEARAKFDAFEKGKDATQGRTLLAEIDKLLTEGLTAAATWEELRETLELQRRLTDSETKREKDLRQFVSVQQALALVGVLIEEINQRVSDREVRAHLARVGLRLIGQGGSAPPESAG